MTYSLSPLDLNGYLRATMAPLFPTAKQAVGAGRAIPLRVRVVPLAWATNAPPFVEAVIAPPLPTE